MKHRVHVAYTVSIRNRFYLSDISRNRTFWRGTLFTLPYEELLKYRGPTSL